MKWDSKRMVRELTLINGIIDEETRTITMKPDVFLKLPDTYPFHPPALRIHGKHYIDYLAKIYKTYASFIRKYNIVMPCICCFSVTCMWSPCNTCQDVYTEYETYMGNLKTIASASCLFKHLPFDDLIHSIIASYLI